MLAEKGAAVNAGGHYDTAPTRAVCLGYEAVVRYLPAIRIISTAISVLRRGGGSTKLNT
jgi:hypothetical protein